MIKGLSSKNLLTMTLALFIATTAFANEYSPNAFKVPPSSNINTPSQQQGFNAGSNRNQLTNVEQNLPQNLPNIELSNVTKALTEKEERSKKILDEVNQKMVNAKNIPVENARYIGIINGKRVYQDNTTLEYVKVDLDK